MPSPTVIFWFRRDLRLADNAGLYHALRSGMRVIPAFIFDTDILSRLSNPSDRRIHFIHHALTALKAELEALGSSLTVIHGIPAEVIPRLAQDQGAVAVFTNHDYEPYAIGRDSRVAELLRAKGIAFHTFKDQCILEKDEVIKDDGTPYTVFTPYSRKWKAVLTDFHLKAYPTGNYLGHLCQMEPRPMPTLTDIGFTTTDLVIPPGDVDDALLDTYHATRDIPSLKGTSRLSVHLRFGTVSIRSLARRAARLNGTFLNELIWRDFYMMVLWHFPHVVKGAFRPQYDHIRWETSVEHFNAWCEGRTGYPIVDAGMRELNATGFMHNRVRMIVASFLTKHLLLPWQWGEAYFAEKLLDFDLSANNGGWQWAAGSGCDAAPYFRVFSPDAQTLKFDPDLKYVRRWVPEFGEAAYPRPIVDHRWARERAIARYREGLAAA